MVETINPTSPAAGMCARRGWVELPDSGGILAYNLPQDTSVEALRNYEQRQTYPQERPSWQAKQQE